jgi:hypothetical protein
MKKPALPTVSLAMLAVCLAGCGGGGSGGSSSSGEPTGGGGVNGISVGNCLNDNYDFIVQPSSVDLTGQSPAGVSFSLRIYKSPAAAQTAYKKKSPKTSAIIENAVIDFQGNPSPYAGAPPAKISKAELANIKTCIDKSK